MDTKENLQSVNTFADNKRVIYAVLLGIHGLGLHGSKSAAKKALDGIVKHIGERHLKEHRIWVELYYGDDDELLFYVYSRFDGEVLFNTSLAKNIEKLGCVM